MLASMGGGGGGSEGDVQAEIAEGTEIAHFACSTILYLVQPTNKSLVSTTKVKYIKN